MCHQMCRLFWDRLHSSLGRLCAPVLAQSGIFLMISGVLGDDRELRRSVLAAPVGARRGADLALKGAREMGDV